MTLCKESDPKCTKDLVFQQFHIELIKPLIREDDDPLPSIRMFGRTDEGLSVCCSVLKFKPTIYISVPLEFEMNHCEALRTTLNDDMLSKVRILEGFDEDMISEVQLPLTNRSSAEKVAKLTTSSYRYYIEVSKIIDLMEVTVPGLKGFAIRKLDSRNTDDIVTMFRKEFNITGFSWIELLAGDYQITSDITNVVRESTCQIEVRVDANRIILHEPTGRWSKVVKFSILSLDIECLASHNVLPNPAVDAVIQISSTAIHYPEAEPYTKRLFTLNSCLPITGAEVSSYNNEKEMLEAWAQFIQELDADMFIGYNLLNFDLRYLLERAKAIKSVTFARTIGRISGMEATIRRVTPTNRLTWRQKMTINIPGRLILDVYLAISNEPAYRARYQRLQDVSMEILGFGKLGVHHSKIPDLHNGDEKSRKELGEYCLQDSLLPILILQKTGLVDKYIKASRQARLQFNEYIRCGHHVSESVVTPSLVESRNDDGEIPVEIHGIRKRSPSTKDQSIKKKTRICTKKQKLGMTPRRLFGNSVATSVPVDVRRYDTLQNVFKPPQQSEEFKPVQTDKNTKKRLGMKLRK